MLALTTSIALALPLAPLQVQCDVPSPEYSTDGVRGEVEASAVFQGDLYLAGDFTETHDGPAAYVTRWDGAAFHAVGAGLPPGGGFREANAAEVLDLGSGPELVVAWNRIKPGTTNNVESGLSRWDGAQWLHVFNTDSILDLASFDDGTGPGAYAVGNGRVLEWNGFDWQPIGQIAGGFITSLRTLVAHDDGSGPALYVGGKFLSIDGVLAASVARWDGSAWSPVGAGLGYTNTNLADLVLHDFGSGTVLVAGGTAEPSGQPVVGAAAWDGVSWSRVGTPSVTVPSALLSLDLGAGPELFAGGSNVFGSGLARFDGAAWSAVFPGELYGAWTLAGWDGGGGERLYAAGSFVDIGLAAVGHVVAYDGSDWETLGTGHGSTAPLQDLALHDDGGGEALFAAGFFKTIGTAHAPHLARWDGANWNRFGGGANNVVNALVSWPGGPGSQLVAAGFFSSIGGTAANRVASWDGASWTPLGNGLQNGEPLALAVYQGDVYAGGSFVQSGNATVNRFSRWDPSSSKWTSFGTGVDGPVRDLLVWDDGSGPALYLAGQFDQLNFILASGVARYDGTFARLGSGTMSPASFDVRALEVFDDGTGEALYVGGDFQQVGGVAASHVARWDGSAWSALGSGLDGPVSALAVHDNGTGPALYVSGEFTGAGGVPVQRLARWDGQVWSGADTDLDAEAVTMLSFDDGESPWASLFLGGAFTSASPETAYHVARLESPCAGTGSSYCTAGTSANGCTALVTSTGTASRSAASGFDVVAAGLEGGAPGVLFFGTSGPQAQPWGNGTSVRCVLSPVRRTGLQPGVGTSGLCDGALTLDFNAWMAAHPQKAPAAGETAYLQGWYRDPQNTSNQVTSLSDGLRFGVLP